MSGLLIVTAVEAERAAITTALRDCASFGTPALPNLAQSGEIDVIVGGVGPAASAAAASAALAGRPYALVLSAGIGGGFAPLVPGDVVAAACIAFADLGAETADGFVPVTALGFGRDRYDVDPQLAIELADHAGAHLGTILTVATVTGSAATADRLAGRYPDAVAEAMEGAGVAAAAEHHGVRFGEIRAISNRVGPRDRDAWQIAPALTALGQAIAGIAQGWTL